MEEDLYTSYAFIDKKFNYFSSFYNRKSNHSQRSEEFQSFPEINSNNISSIHEEKQNHTKILPERNSNLFRLSSMQKIKSSTFWEKTKNSSSDKKNKKSPKKYADFEEIIKKSAENYEENYHNKFDARTKKNLISFFKNSVFAAFFETLIEEVATETNFNQNNQFSIPNHILGFLHITREDLEKKGSPENQRKYILKIIQKTNDELLEKWRRKHETKEEKHKLNYKSMQENYEYFLDERKDPFSWLNLKSKYADLQRKLKLILIEKINNYENQMKINNEISKSSEQNKSLSKSIKMQNIPEMRTSIILQNINSSQISTEPSKLEQSRSFYLNDACRKEESSHRKLINSIFNVKSLETLKDSKHNYIWSEEKEKIFFKNKELAKQKYSKLLKASNFYSSALSPFIHEKNLELNKKFQRDVKLKQYGNGDLLNAEELKFIADTSVALNSCMDKNFLKKACSLIDEEVISNLELYIAENIVMGYQEMKEIIKNSRNQYLRDKSKETINKLKNKELETKLEHEKEEKIIQRKKSTKLFSILIDKIDNSVKKNNNSYLQKNIKKETSSREEKFRKYHPPSKLMTKEYYEAYYSSKKIEDIERKNSELTHKYKICSNSNSEKNKKDFWKYYSGGPQTHATRKSFNETKVILIQKRIRMFLAKRRLKKLKQQNEEKKLSVKNSCNYEKNSRLEKPKITRALFLKKTENPKKILEEHIKLEKVQYSRDLKKNRLFHCVIKNDFKMLLCSGLHFDKEDLNSYDKNGNVALHYSCKNENLNLTEFLIAKGADVNLKCKNGNTPVHNACKTNNLDLINILLINGGNLNVLNDQGFMPMAYLNFQNAKKLNLMDSLSNISPSVY